jgi:hypothetical protein
LPLRDLRPGFRRRELELALSVLAPALSLERLGDERGLETR